MCLKKYGPFPKKKQPFKVVSNASPPQKRKNTNKLRHMQCTTSAISETTIIN